MQMHDSSYGQGGLKSIHDTQEVRNFDEYVQKEALTTTNQSKHDPKASSV